MEHQIIWTWHPSKDEYSCTAPWGEQIVVKGAAFRDDPSKWTEYVRQVIKEKERLTQDD